MLGIHALLGTLAGGTDIATEQYRKKKNPKSTYTYLKKVKEGKI